MALTRNRSWLLEGPDSSAPICANACFAEGNDVLCVDNYFTGRKDNIAHLLAIRTSKCCGMI